MRYVATLIVLALLSTTAVGQTQVASKDVSQIRQFVARQPIGQELYVSLKTGQKLEGSLAQSDAENFEITVGKRLEKIAYSTVDSVAAVRSTKRATSEKQTFWKRVGRGFQMSFGIATIATLFVATYPTTMLAEHGANAKASALKKEIATALPRGTSKSQVIAFLDSRKIEYSAVRIPKWVIPYPVAEYIKNPNRIDASLSCRNWFSFYVYYIAITFHFDEADRLIDSEVDVLADGL